MSQRILIVDGDDNVIGTKVRGALVPGDIYRVSALWLTDGRGRVLLAQRSFAKAHDPGKWGPAAAGTVEEGKSYEVNINKEIEEEIGLTGLTLRFGPKERVTGKHNFFGQWFLAETDVPVESLKLQAEEVAKVKWMTLEELEKDIRENPGNYLDSMMHTVRLFGGNSGN